MGARRRGVVSLLAGLLLVAVLVPVGAGARSGAGGDGSVSGVRVWSDEVGVLRVSWAPADPVPSDHRVRWAPEGEGFRSWRDLSGNAFPESGSLVLEGLDADRLYRVQVRARYYDGRGNRLWSGPWSDVAAGRASGGDVAGTVLAGTMAWGASAAGGYDMVGYSRPVHSGGPDRVGHFEMRFWDGVVVRSRVQLFALAQIQGSVAVGPAAGLEYPVVLTVTTGVDLSAGFMVEVGDVLYDSAEAVNPQGDVGVYRYWMWDSPSDRWAPGQNVEFRIIAADADDGAQTVPADASLGMLGIAGVALGSSFDPGVKSYSAVARSGVARVTVDVAPSDPGARWVRITPPDADPRTDGHQVDVNGDGTPTVVTVKVTAADKRTTNSYSVTVTRAEPLSNDATLASLSLNDGDLSPDFDTATDAYSKSVPASTGWVTVAAGPTFDGAQAAISPPDANPLLEGHQVDLAASPNGADNGTTDIAVTVTAQDHTTGTYNITVTRPPATNFHSGARVIEPRNSGVGWLKGLWSDGRTMFVAIADINGFLPGDVFKFDMATRVSRPITDWRASRLKLREWRAGRPFSPYFSVYAADVWSDGESMWVLDRWGAVTRHDLVDGEDYVVVRDQELELAFDSVEPFRPPGDSYSYGIWSDGDIMWVSNSGEYTTKVRAFDLGTGEPMPDRDIANRTPIQQYQPGYGDWGNYGAHDIWSDGTTMWVVYRRDQLIRAYDLASGDRRSHLDIVTTDWGPITDPKGLWSDGGMMWIGSYNIYGFYLPTQAALGSLSVSDADIGTFNSWSTSYTATVTDTTDTVTVEVAAQHNDASVVILPADTDPDTPEHQISLSPGENTITVTAGTYNHTMTYTITVTR